MIVRNLLVAFFLFIFLIVYVVFIKEPQTTNENTANTKTSFYLKQINTTKG